MSGVITAIVAVGVLGAVVSSDNTRRAINNTMDDADRNRAAAKDITDEANNHIIRAQLLANQGLLEASAMAVEEARQAREQALAYIKESTAKAQEYLDATLYSTEKTIIEGQNRALAILDEYGDKSADLYRPYVDAGTKALGEIQKMAGEGVQMRGAPIYGTTPGQAKTYEQWKADRLSQLASTGGSQSFNEQTGEYETITYPEDQLQAEYQQYVADLPPVSTDQITGYQPADLTQSPYYGLYKFQQDQQQKSIQNELGARGIYDSGAGIQKQVNADTGLTESFTATEYQRMVDDYNRKLAAEETLLQTGYGATGNLASIYGALGANKAGVVQWGSGTVANLQAQTGLAKANAAIGQGTSSAGISQQTGNQLATIYNQLGTNQANTAMSTGQSQASTANQLGTTLANIYMNASNNRAQILNQQAQNRTNLYSGLANTALYSWLRQQPATNNYNYGTNYNPSSYQMADTDWGAASGYPF